MGVGGFVVRTLAEMNPHDRYALPYLGRTFRGIDQYADYQRMYADYMRRVGREIKYPSIRDPRALGGSALGDVTTHMTNVGLKTARWLV